MAIFPVNQWSDEKFPAGQLRAEDDRLDDFGAAYSSLNYLHRLPVDFIKLDRTLVDAVGTGAQARTIAASFVSVAKTLSLRTVVEGTERPRLFGPLMIWGAIMGRDGASGTRCLEHLLSVRLARQGRAGGAAEPRTGSKRRLPRSHASWPWTLRGRGSVSARLPGALDYQLRTWRRSGSGWRRTPTHRGVGHGVGVNYLDVLRKGSGRGVDGAVFAAKRASGRPGRRRDALPFSTTAIATMSLGRFLFYFPPAFSASPFRDPTPRKDVT